MRIIITFCLIVVGSSGLFFTFPRRSLSMPLQYSVKRVKHSASKESYYRKYDGKDVLLDFSDFPSKGGKDAKVKVFELSSMADPIEKTFKQAGKAENYQYFHRDYDLDGKAFFTFDGQKRSIKYWSLDNESLICEIPANDIYTPYVVTYKPDLLITTGKQYSNKIYVWNLTNGQLIKAWTLPDFKLPFDFTNPGKTGSIKEKISEIKILPDKITLMVSTISDRVQFWNVQTGQYEWQINVEQSGIYSVEFSHNGKYIATAARYGGVKVWDIEKRKLRTHITNFDQMAYSIAFSADDRILAACGKGSQNNIVLWDVIDNKLMTEMRNLTGLPYVFDYKISKNSQFILVDGLIDKRNTKSVSIYSTVSGRMIATLPVSAYSSEFLDDNQIFVRGDDGVGVWQVILLQ
jgi:WD40 repeat protein